MKSRGWKVSDEVREVADRAEHSLATFIGKRSKSWLRQNQKSLKEEIFRRALEEMKSEYRKNQLCSE